MTDNPEDTDNREGHDRPIDFSALDSAPDADALESMVRRIHLQAMPELVRLHSSVGLGAILLRWRRSILASTALIAVAAALVLLLVKPVPSTESGTTLAEALGVPRTMATWVHSSRSPAPGEILTSGETP